MAIGYMNSRPLSAHSRFSHSSSPYERITKRHYVLIHHSSPFLRKSKPHKLPLRFKQLKTSSNRAPSTSPKRTHSDADEEDRPTKLQKLSPEPDTNANGFKEVDVFAEPTAGKKKATTLSKDDLEIYARRAKVSTYASKLRKKRKMAKRVRAVWKDMPDSAQQGMKNLTGVLCYRHSLFQSLVHAPKVVYWLRNYHTPELCVWEGKAPCVACGLRDVVNAFWSGVPSEMTNALSKINQVFKTNHWTAGGWAGQADPEEQFTWIIGKMCEQLPTEAYELFKAFSHFVLDASTCCKKCGHVSTNKGEIEGTISVPIQPRIPNGDLSAYLKKYFNDSVYGFKCDKCKDEAKKFRPRHIAHSPDLILIQLKRFNGQGRKDSYPVPFSTTLDLNSYRTPSNRTNSEYELSAVVSHSGTTSSGHYRCTAKGADKCWNIFDDSHVSMAKTAQVTAPGNGKGWTPYLLFYQRILLKSN